MSEHNIRLKSVTGDTLHPETKVDNLVDESGEPVAVATLDSNSKVPVASLPAMTGATGSAAGTTGAVPAPAAADNTKYLKGDGTWASTPTEVEWATYGTTTYSQIKAWSDAGKAVLCKYNSQIYSLDFISDIIARLSKTCVTNKNVVGAYGSATSIFVSGSTWSSFDATFQNEIPAGTSGQVVTYTGTAGSVGSASLPTTMTGADGSAAGTSGLVPAPAATDNTKFLRGDGTWVAASTVAAIIREW